jgi:phosphoribosylaminoimidazolecarboxamide formyltransferase/IMP cyclohydrolase
MTRKDLKAAYRIMAGDHFPPGMEIAFVDGDHRQTLFFEKATWTIDNEERGLRYGENPGQEAALYRLVNGNLQLGEVTCIQAGRHLASDVELLQSGKHPGKTNITDVDNALNILRYLMDAPCAAIMKHNNPCGVARADSLLEAYDRANMADRLAAFGGAIALNREVDIATAEAIAANYAEVVVAPGFAEGVMSVFETKKSLRVLQIDNMQQLQDYAGLRFVDFKSLIDGGVITQWSYVPETRSAEQLMLAETAHKGDSFKINRPPTPQELDDMIFGWLVEAGVTSNSVLYIKDGATVGIGTGEQDRVGVAEIARDKAYRKLADRICWERHGIPYNTIEDDAQREAIDGEVQERRGGLPGSAMISDAFFPFRDGVDVGIQEGVSAIVQPGGSMRDYESIEACNASDVTMMFTGQRSFRH